VLPPSRRHSPRSRRPRPLCLRALPPRPLAQPRSRRHGEQPRGLPRLPRQTVLPRRGWPSLGPRQHLGL
jgi:hypothetical protein